MIPNFITNGNLPPGIHYSTWNEFITRYGYTDYRRNLITGFQQVLDILKTVGCQTVYVDGSFITTKQIPGDFDTCWDPSGVDVDLLYQIEPNFIIMDRCAQKAKYHGDIFPNFIEKGSGLTFLEFFQYDRQGNSKGIVAFDLRGIL